MRVLDRLPTSPCAAGAALLEAVFAIASLSVLGFVRLMACSAACRALCSSACSVTCKNEKVAVRGHICTKHLSLHPSDISRRSVLSEL